MEKKGKSPDDAFLDFRFNLKSAIVDLAALFSPFKIFMQVLGSIKKR